MEQLNIKGLITATSKKGTKFDGTPNDRKTAYFEADTENTKKAVEFGLREYTSRDDGKKFFIIQLTSEVDVYNQFGEIVQTLDGGIETANFSTNKPVNLAILKGENKGNVFYRLKGIQGEIEEVAPQNLFANTSEDLPF